MKRLSLLCVLALSLPAFAEDKYLGTLVSTGSSVTNSSTASPFNSGGYDGARLSVQCDATAYVRVVTTSTGTVTSSNGVKLAADQLYDIDMEGGSPKWLAAISASGTANCKVFSRLGLRR